MKRAVYLEDGTIRYEEAPERQEPTPAAPTPTVWDELDAAYQEGVDSV
ncbi:MAG: hypothetical protein IJ484_04010 [Oscillospiraceae bacterium]|nr:hypothetical protein [Oscillospiraceae bacterium]